jgi:alpha-ketoglutarate-dependent taurine dioxygenase
LRNRVEGGSSYFVDSFAAAREILGDPDYSPPFIDFEYDNDGHYLHHSHPLMPRDRANLYKLKAAVNWSPPFQGVPNLGLTGRHRGAQMAWYRALDVFQTTIDQTHRKWEFTMKEGDLVLFDNRRVLHARRAFRDWSEKERIERGVEIVEGESSRWLKGCYLDGEVVWDKLATLNSKLNAPNTR